MNAPTSSPLTTLLCMSAALFIGLMSSAIADDGAAALPEVLLNSGAVQLPAANALLIRTSMTPSKVTLHIPVEMGETICTESAQIPRTGQNGAQCGYDRLVRRVCHEVPVVCHVERGRRRPVCTTPRRECHNEVITQARVCTWLVTECVRTGVAHSTAERKVLLKLKDLPALATGETETYEIRASQNRLNGSDAIVSLASVSTKGPVKIKERDGLFTGFKDIITVKAE